MSLDDLCIQDLVELQSRSTPDAIAIVAGSDCATYGELNARANQLAHRLCSMGVGPEVPVGLCMERSIELAIAALGILKAGGAYVALDPADPSQRLAMLVEQSETKLVVTQSHVAPKLRGEKWQAVVVNRSDPDASYDRPPALTTKIKADNLAYTIFTSGSTGRPKGV